MGILFMEGMDGFSTQIQANRRGMYSNGSIYQEANQGRFGGGALHPVGAGGSGISPMFIPVVAASNTVFFAFAQKITETSGTGWTFSIWRGWSGAITPGGGSNTCVYFQGLGGGVIGVYNAAGTKIGQFSMLPDQIWHWWSIKAVCLGSTSGSIEVYMDGTLVFSATGVNLAGSSATGNNYSFALGVRGGSGEYTPYGIVDDIIIADDTGAKNNGVIPDSRIITRFAANTDTAGAWAPNTGTFEGALDENPGQDDDTTYVTSSTAGDAFFVGFNAMTVTPSAIHAAKATLIARKTGAEGTTLTARLKSGTSIVAATAKGLSTSYDGARGIFENDPAGGDWTLAAANAVKVGGLLS